MVELDTLWEVVKRLRGPNGCPWDRKQSHQTLKPCLIEETYEVLDAIESQNPESLKEELGDLLLQVLAHSQIAEENHAFSLQEVLREVTEKLVRRHPHVFGEEKAEDADDALKNWARIKEGERNDKGAGSILDGVPNALPALLRAQRVTEKASHAGFDWKEVEEVKEKVHEEWEEFATAVACNNIGEVQAEFGDLLLSLVNLARFLQLDSETALTRAVRRFEERFRFVERNLKLQGKSMRDSDMEEMEHLWNQAKSVLHEKNESNREEI